jgi:hypothetical protein
VLRPELGSNLVQYIELAVKSITDAAEGDLKSENIYRQRDITDNMLCLWGGIEDSALDPVLKGFLFIGKYLERIDLFTRFGLPAEQLNPALKKLSVYAATLDAMPLPQCLASGAKLLLQQLPARGYESLAVRIQEFLNEFQGRVLDLDSGRNSVLNAMNMDARRP